MEGLLLLCDNEKLVAILRLWWSMFFLIVHGNIALGGCEKLLLQLDRLRNNIKERKYLIFVLNVFENFSHDMEKSIS